MKQSFLLIIALLAVQQLAAAASPNPPLKVGIVGLEHGHIDLAKVVSDPDFKKKLANIGSYSRAMTPEQALAFVNKEQQTWLPVLDKISTK